MVIRILLYGKSIFIAGIASILAGNPNLDLQRCSASDLDALPTVDIILTDLCETETLRVLPQLSVKLGCALVGIDPATGATTVLSGTAHRMNSTQELMTFLQSAVLQAVPQINTSSTTNSTFSPVLKTQKEVPRK